MLKKHSAADQPKGKKPKNINQTLWQLWKTMRKERLKLVIVFLLVAMSALLALAGPFIVGMSIDRFIATGEVNGFVWMLGLLLIVYLFHSLTVWLQQFVMIGISQRTVYRLRSQLFDHLLQLPIRFFDRSEQGDLMSRVNNDIENVSNTLNSSVIQVFTSVITLIGIVIVMLYLSPILTLVAMLVVPMMFFGIRWITKRTRVLFKEQQSHLGELNGYSEEAISAHSITKMFSQEDQMIERFQEKNATLRETGFWAQVYSGIPKFMNALNSFSFAIIALAGGVLAVNGLVTVGVIVIFVEYSRQFTRPLNDLANQFNLVLSAIAGAERVFSVLEEEKEQTDEKDAKVIDWEVQGNVQFQNVSFSYDTTPTIQDVTYHVNAGQTVALVGKTGAGKTTMMNLLTRFYELDEGILLDGISISTLTRDSLRENMAVVLQDPFLFHETVLENVRYSVPEATRDEVIEACKLANAHPFIRELSQGYDTMLEDGKGISQGQKQLLSIARAILRNPKLLLLDEATSSIDSVTEMHLQRALDTLMEGRTSFVIAHRLNTVKNADQLFIFDDGTIVEHGSHEELIDQRGVYYELHTAQQFD
ncbi:LOW QUALITY PROTEIN: lipid A export ATP-binding/permease protein MsbA [Geomicrobium sp. JCM 19038]|nr:LOW QUALITY PROTEIN: lipid A export ATP-binding/permease protein MsbA [Geomicrobium sp. JCM 19038]